jgi:hypothetical protein
MVNSSKEGNAAIV